MKVLATILVLILLSGCTFYSVKTERDENGLLRSDVKVASSRNFKRIGGGYEREGSDAAFDFQAEGVTQPGPEEYVKAGIAIGAAAAGASVSQEEPEDQ